MTQRKHPQLKAFSCAAAHDETPSPRDFYFDFCRSNLICSHGNNILDEIINRAEKEEKVTSQEAAQMRELIKETREKSRKAVDYLATMRGYLRRRDLSQQTLDLIKARLTDELGSDVEDWEKRQIEIQLEVIQPILEVANRLRALGVMDFPAGITSVCREKVISRSYTS